MIIPLIILAVLSLVGGWINVPEILGGNARFDKFLAPVFNMQTVEAPAAESSEAQVGGLNHSEDNTALILTGVSVAVAGFGIFLAWLLYYKRPELPERIAKTLGGLYTLVLEKYKIDELYGAVFIQPLVLASTNIFWKGIDRGLIDGAVDGGAAGAQDVSDEMRRMQSGNIRSYAGWVAVGAAVVIAYMVWKGLR